MLLQSYNRIELQQFIDSDFFKNLNQIPISYHRAVSHIHNPDIQDDDELLWAVYQGDQLLGYVGVLPGKVNMNNESKRIFWLSCFWVDESARKTNIASILFFSLLKRYREQLFISNFLPNLEKTYQGLRIFNPTFYKTGSKFYCKSCFSDILPTRFPKTRLLKPLLIFIDFTINLFIDFRKIFIKPLSIQSKIVSLNTFDNEFQHFIQSFYKDKDYVERFAEHFEWILKYPWVLEGKADQESKRYYFSSKAEQFEYDVVKFYKEKKLKAFLWLKIRDKKLSVSYVFAEEDLYDDITNYILQKVYKGNLKVITVFNPLISNRIRNHKNRYLFERNVKLPYITPKTMEINPRIFQEGDGDNIFT